MELGLETKLPCNIVIYNNNKYFTDGKNNNNFIY